MDYQKPAQQSVLSILLFLFIFSSFTHRCSAQETLLELGDLIAFSSSNEHSTLNPQTRILTSSADVTVSNLSEQTFRAPLQIVFELSVASGVQMPGAAGGPGTQPYGKFYFDLSASLPPGGLAPGGQLQFTPVFARNSSVRFTYQMHAYGIAAAAENLAPIADAGAGRTLTLAQGEPTVDVQLDGSASHDPDGTIVAYRWSGTPDPADSAQPTVTLGVGNHVFTLIVVDDQGTSSSAGSVTISVLAAGAIPPPELQIDPLHYSLDEGTTLTIPVSATSANNARLTLAAAPRITHGKFSAQAGAPAQGSFVFGPQTGQRGTYDVTFTARNPSGMTDQKTVRIEVKAVNHAPTIGTLPMLTVDEGDLLSFNVPGSDPDGDALHFVANGLPANTIFNAATGQLTFAPNFGQAGDYQVLITASDGTLSSPEVALKIHVNDVSQGQGGAATPLTLTVDPIGPVSVLPSQRVTGAVNSAGGDPVPSATMGLINGLSPAAGKQGVSMAVTIKGFAGEPLMTHFAAGTSTANFGAGIVVNALQVTSATQAVAQITIAPGAALGPRSVSVTTGDETAVSIVAFNVQAGSAGLSATLQDPDTGLPLAGALVSLQGTGFTTTTDADGHFTLLNVPPGSYTLVINAPNHDLITMTVEVGVGLTQDLGPIKPASLVFDPTAPPGVSLLSVIGRGAGDVPAKPDLAKLRQMVIDALLLVCGDEGGVLDEYGNQLNAQLDGPGLLSANAAGVQALAIATGRGETLALQDILYALSFGLSWSGEPFSLEEWLETLQAQVNAAWLDTRNVENALPLLIFNKGNALLLDPPKVDAATRLTPLQAYLLISSLLVYASLEATPQPRMADAGGDTGIVSDAYAFIDGRHDNYMLAQAGGGAGDPAPKPYTRFWRNFFSAKSATVQLAIQSASTQAILSSMMGAQLQSSGSILGTLTGGQIAGSAGDALAAALLGAHASQYVPEPPVIKTAGTFAQDDGTTPVRITFKRSSSDTGQTGGALFVYSLYRMRGDLIPQLVARTNFSSTQTLEFLDSNAIEGTSAYAMNVTRYINKTSGSNTSWWGVGLQDSLEVFVLGRDAFTSDYSAPVTIYVGPIDFAPSLDGLEVDPRPGEDAVYYSDAGKGVFYKIDRTGLGSRHFFANANFKPSNRDGRTIQQVGLAIDQAGNLYSENASSDEQFGGRIFRFLQPNGLRELCGTINYYSFPLQFAHPTLSGPMAIRPADQHLVIIDNMEGTLKDVAVQDTYDANRRVGQPFATLPAGGTGRVIDLEYTSDSQRLYIMDGYRVLKFENGVFTTDALFTTE